MDESPGSPFGDRLRQFREAAGWSQEALAERSGLSVRGISDLERGARRLPRLETVRLLADALQLAADDRAVLLAAARSSSSASAPTAGAALPLFLPVPLTPLIDRQVERARLRALLASPVVRLVTITGPGGVGKTCLALAVAATLHDEFPDGIGFVDLAPIRDPALILATVAATLKVAEQSDRSLLETLQHALADRRLLLILDNCEHLVAAAPDVGRLLAGTRGLAILATSRQRLELRGEHEFSLAPLATADPENAPALSDLATVPSIALFVARAQDIHPDFVLIDANAAAVAGVCRRLDGLPLAIELAAARVKVLSPSALSQRLNRRLPLLTGGARDLPARQRTLTAAIAWSYDLLEPAEQRLFQQLSVFSGGMSFEAVETVCEDADEADLLALLASLVDKSLVRQTALGDGEPRFDMLETIREYALAQLQAAGDEAVMLSRHAAWCRSLAEQAESACSGPEEAAWLERLDRERDNLRGALEAMLTGGDGELALRLAVALWPFWTRRGLLREGHACLERALNASPTAPSPLRATAFYRLGSLAIDLGHYEQARALYEQSRQLAQNDGDDAAVARALTGLGIVAADTGAADEAHAHYREALAIRERLGDRRELARAHFNLGYLASMTGAVEDALAQHRQALALHQAADAETADLAYALFGLGQATRRAGQLTEALPLIAEARRMFDALDDPLGVAYAQLAEGRILLAQGPIDAAEQELREATVRCHALGDRVVVIEGIEALSLTAWRRQDLHRAARLLEGAAAWRRRLGVAAPRAERPALDALKDALARQGHHVRSDADDRPAPSLEQLVLEATKAIGRTPDDAQ